MAILSLFPQSLLHVSRFTVTNAKTSKYIVIFNMIKY